MLREFTNNKYLGDDSECSPLFADGSIFFAEDKLKVYAILKGQKIPLYGGCHSGVNHILEDESFKVIERKESIVTRMTLDGVLTIDGTLTIL